MRQIEMMGRAIAKLIFNKNTTEYVIIDYQLLKDTDLIHNQLLALIDDGKLNEAENLLFEKIHEEIEENAGRKDYLEVAVDFYARLNELNDKTLDDYGFEREEIDEGIREAAELYGVNII